MSPRSGGSAAAGALGPASPRGGSGDNLVGRKVMKHWEGHGWYHGGVINTFLGEGKQRYYKVRFDDGDVEDYSLLELRQILKEEEAAPPDAAEQPSGFESADPLKQLGLLMNLSGQGDNCVGLSG